MKKLGSTSRYSFGYTLVEITVVMIVIGIIATVSIMSYGNFRKSISVAQLKSDLNNVVTSMENSRTFGNVYPTTIPSNFTATSGITLQGGSIDSGKTYCVDAVNSSIDSNMYYYVDSMVKSQGAQLGSCISSRPVPSDLTIAVATNTALNLSWSAVSNASNYSLQQDTNSSFSSPVTINRTTNSYQATGLIQGTTYYYRLNVTVTSGTSVWSTTYSGVPVIPVPSIAPVVAVALTGGNIQATLQTAYPTCSLGTIQYAYNNRTNDNSTWNGYSSWSTNLTSAQTATQGVKYGYKAEARCYVDSVSYSAATEGSEASTIIAIDTPSAPTGLTYGYDWQGTTWSWNATPCPSGSTTNYNVDYSNDYAGDSGWTSLGTNSSWRQTSRYQVNYSMAVKTQCVGSYSTSGWSSATSPLTFYRNAPVIRALIVAGGGGGGFDNGGGGGGFIDTYITVTQSMQQTTYWGISIGGGGGPQANGGNSSFMNLTAYGGGRGANCCGAVGGNGGSGGGGSGVGSGNSGYSGNFSPPSGQSYAQFLGQTNSYVNYGGRGGNRSSCSSYTGGGGGGAGNIGGDAWSGGGGPGAQNGGAGAYTSINGGTYAAGGGGGGDCYNGSGGSGGGGNGAQGRGATGGNASGYGSGGGGGSGRSGQGGYGYQGLVIVQSGDGSIPSGTYTGNNTLTVSGYYQAGGNNMIKFNKKIIYIISTVVFVIIVAGGTVIVLKASNNNTQNQNQSQAVPTKATADALMESSAKTNDPAKAKALLLQARQQYVAIDDKDRIAAVDAEIKMIDTVPKKQCYTDDLMSQ